LSPSYDIAERSFGPPLNFKGRHEAVGSRHEAVGRDAMSTTRRAITSWQEDRFRSSFFGARGGNRVDNEAPAI